MAFSLHHLFLKWNVTRAQSHSHTAIQISDNIKGNDSLFKKAPKHFYIEKKISLTSAEK